MTPTRAMLMILMALSIMLVYVPAHVHSAPTRDDLVKMWSTTPEIGEGFYDYLYIFANGTFFISKDSSLYCESDGPLDTLTLGQAGRWKHEADGDVILVVEQELKASAPACACAKDGEYNRVPCGVEIRKVVAQKVPQGRVAGSFTKDQVYESPFKGMRGPILEAKGLGTFYPVVGAAVQDLSDAASVLNRNHEGARMPDAFLKAMDCKRDAKKITCAAKEAP